MTGADTGSATEDHLLPHWAIAVTAAREQPRELQATIASVLDASHQPVLVDVMVNGNRTLAEDTARFAATMPESPNHQVRVWWLELGDKAHALNQYIHHVWTSRQLLFLTDGYVRLNSDALQLLGDAMQEAPHALGGSGVPTVGRSAAAIRQHLVEDGGLHGNFCCIRGATVDELKRRGFRLPLGLYRVDSTLGAVLCFGLDPAKNSWDSRRIRVQPEASWATREKRWWRLADVQGYFNRRRRQAQGRLENLAVEYFLKTRQLAPEALPRTVQDLVFRWRDENPEVAQQLLSRSRLCRESINRLETPVDWSLADVAPMRMGGV